MTPPHRPPHPPNKIQDILLYGQKSDDSTHLYHLKGLSIYVSEPIMYSKNQFFTTYQITINIYVIKIIYVQKLFQYIRQDFGVIQYCKNINYIHMYENISTFFYMLVPYYKIMDFKMLAQT